MAKTVICRKIITKECDVQDCYHGTNHKEHGCCGIMKFCTLHPDCGMCKDIQTIPVRNLETPKSLVWKILDFKIFP